MTLMHGVDVPNDTPCKDDCLVALSLRNTIYEYLSVIVSKDARIRELEDRVAKLTEQVAMRY